MLEARRHSFLWKLLGGAWSQKNVVMAAVSNWLVTMTHLLYPALIYITGWNRCHVYYILRLSLVYKQDNICCQQCNRPDFSLDQSDGVFNWHCQNRRVKNKRKDCKREVQFVFICLGESLSKMGTTVMIACFMKTQKLLDATLQLWCQNYSKGNFIFPTIQRALPLKCFLVCLKHPEDPSQNSIRQSIQ